MTDPTQTPVDALMELASEYVITAIDDYARGLGPSAKQKQARDAVEASARALAAIPAQVVTVDSIRAAGGIVHSDGNIFFTNIDKLRAALSHPSTPQGWQPIESAPKDGKCLILREGDRTFYGSWLSIPFREYRDSDGFYVGQQDPESYWMDHEGGDEVEPTYWWPLTALPPPPEQGSKG